MLLNEKKDDEQLFKREIHTFVLRAGRMTAAEQRDYEEFHEQWCVPFTGKYTDFRSIFGNGNPIVVEIGFGMGTATALIAESNPDINYLGLEVHRPGVGKLLGEIQKKALSNIRIIEFDALTVLETMIENGTVDAFHIFFPDPWPKVKHHKRRLVQRPRTELLAKKLRNGGYLYMATDWLPYAEFALKELTQTDGLENKFDGFAPHQSWRPETRFEAKGRSANRSISELFFLRNEKPVTELMSIPQKTWKDEL